jgi:hypothetical protein
MNIEKPKKRFELNLSKIKQRILAQQENSICIDLTTEKQNIINKLQPESKSYAPIVEY